MFGVGIAELVVILVIAALYFGIPLVLVAAVLWIALKMRRKQPRGMDNDPASPNT